MKNKIKLLLLSVFMCITSCEDKLTKSLKVNVAEANKSLPASLSAGITLNKMSSDGHKLTFHYSIDDNVPNLVDMLKVMAPIATVAMCSDPEIGALIGEGQVNEFEYSQGGRVVFKYQVGSEECKGSLQEQLLLLPHSQPLVPDGNPEVNEF